MYTPVNGTYVPDLMVTKLSFIIIIIIFENYLQIQSNTPINYQQNVKHCLTSTGSGIKTECFPHLVNSGQEALRKLAYSQISITE